MGRPLGALVAGVLLAVGIIIGGTLAITYGSDAQRRAAHHAEVKAAMASNLARSLDTAKRVYQKAGSKTSEVLGLRSKEERPSSAPGILPVTATTTVTTTPKTCPTSGLASGSYKQWKTPPPRTIHSKAHYVARVKTTAGTFQIALDAARAPTTVNNFIFLAKHGYYNCVTFDRVIPTFLDQAGDPTGLGHGGPGYTFANENIPSRYVVGDVAMANSSAKHSNGSQFFVVVPGGTTTLDQDLHSGDAYPLFGRVTSGMSVLEAINRDGNSATTGTPPKVIQRILSVTITT